MSLRILHLSEATPQSPFLSSQAAAARWLPGALRQRGHAVVERSLSSLSPGQHAELFGHFDVVQIHGGDFVAADLDAPLVRTRYDLAAARASTVAVSWRQAREWPHPPQAVVPPSIPTSLVGHRGERADHFVTVFNGDLRALNAALDVARAAERELVVLTSGAEPGSLPKHALLRERVVDGDDLPEDLVSAAAYLSFTKAASDVAAVSAMASGTPVITLDGLAAAELVVSGESGYVCHNVDEAKRAAERLDLLDPRLCVARAEALFDVEGAARRYEELYLDATQARSRRFRHPELATAR